MNKVQKEQELQISDSGKDSDSLKTDSDFNDADFLNSEDRNMWEAFMKTVDSQVDQSSEGPQNLFESVDSQTWKNDDYWKLPQNVRHAIDIAKTKQPNSDFYYKLQNLNDKVLVYKHVFYSNMPAHQKQFLERKRKEL